MYKTYTADIVDEHGIVKGSRAVSIWFFWSPLVAFKRIGEMGGNYPVNFRRVK